MVQVQTGQHFFMTNASPGIPIHLIHKFSNRFLAVSDHMARHSFGHSDQLTIDHQHSMVKSLDHLFDQP